ncbi:Hsp20/alpha crystallin family protein [Nitratidesulfovibrio liaohensis]|uniref:Hsp20/alpha crystallin family protein n=1 Tax=Nitratidesulfovibrio liaohensis TaxID=2604158 RepID=UPI001AAE613E|nr:Hsp20/alpha crystallin family protein [Nitratidesulfovibrio liaohensis]NHZ45411.1 Hsp20/alpha crystallin family protein [Nitratidesulfovibrio liaohensis]
MPDITERNASLARARETGDTERAASVREGSATRIERVSPATDIIEQADGFHILMDLPGVPPDGLTIDLEENEVTVTGRSSYAPAGNDRRMHAEFDAVEFVRTFTLSDMVDRERIRAVLKDGVLNLFLPKAEAAKPRRIEISQG